MEFDQIINKKFDWQVAVWLVGLLIVGSVASFSYRGIYSDDTAMYINRAEQIYSAHQLRGGETLSVASILYAALIALAYVIVGQTLLATHLFPFLLAALIPLLFFLVLRKLVGDIFWAGLGSLLYLFYPTNMVWLNQNLTEPVFVFCLMLALLTLTYAPEQPKLLIGVGLAAALLMLARLFDGAVFAGLLWLAVIYQQRKRFPTRWFLFGVGAFVGVHLLCALLLRYSPVEYYHYFQQMLRHDNVAVNYLGELSPHARTMIAVKIYLRWFLGGVWAPIFLLLMGIGLIPLLRQKMVYPLLCLVGYVGFLLFVLGGRDAEPLLTRLSGKILPALVILLVCGGKTVYDGLAGVALKKLRTRIPADLFGAVFFLGLGWFAFQQNQQFLRMMTEIIPSVSLGQIIHKNFAFASMHVDNTQNIREEIYQRISGAYRPAYRSMLAKQAFDAQLPQKLQAAADYAFHADFQDNVQWRQALTSVSGSSALWSPQYPGQIGAFPYQAGGTLVYRFAFPRKIQQAALSDRHAQWAPGDIVRMWTSGDGQTWVLRYDDQLPYQPTYYHQILTDEVRGAQQLFVKYYFYAGDPARAADDNRGAALQQLFVAVTYQN